MNHTVFISTLTLFFTLNLYASSAGRPLLSQSSTDEEVEQFYASFPDSTFKKHFVYYFDTKSEEIHGSLKTEDEQQAQKEIISQMKNIEERLKRGGLAAKETNNLSIEKYGLLLDIFDLDLLNLQKNLESLDQIELTATPAVEQRGEKYKIPSLSSEGSSSFRKIFDVSIGIDYKPTKNEQIQATYQALEALNLTLLQEKFKLCYEKFSNCGEFIKQYSKDHAETLNRLSSDRSEYILNSKADLEIIISFKEASRRFVLLLSEALEVLSEVDEKDLERIREYTATLNLENDAKYHWDFNISEDTKAYVFGETVKIKINMPDFSGFPNEMRVPLLLQFKNKILESIPEEMRSDFSRQFDEQFGLK